MVLKTVDVVKTPIQLTTEQADMIIRNSDFSFNLFRAVNKGDMTKSFILSPVSATFVLGMLNNGAKGQSAEEILSVLGFKGSDARAVNEFCQKLIEGSPQVDPEITLKIASYIAINNSNGNIELQSQYHKDMIDYYHCEVASLDFTSPIALSTINNWCSQHTDGAIPSILNDLDQSAAMVLMNAVNFKALWTNKFEEKNTKEDTFTQENGNKITLPLMHQLLATRYASNDTYSIVELPYGTSGRKFWKMYVLLPNEGKTVDDVLETLNGNNWTKQLNQFNMSSKVDLKIPRFSTSGETDLVPPLMKAGVLSIFDANVSDLSNICSNNNLYVSIFKQNVRVEVNERGTVAQAVTAATGMSTGVESNKIYTFYANRPFVYIVQESSSMAIFFMGIYRGN